MKNNLKLLGMVIVTCLALTACKKDKQENNSQPVAEQVSSEDVQIPEGLGQVMQDVWGEDMPLADGARDPIELSENGEFIEDQDEPFIDEGESKWSVHLVQDMINGDKMLYKNVSLNMHDIDNVFTEMVMYVREKKGSKYFDKVDYEVFFKVDSGRFFCMNMGECYINTKIGGEPHRYYYNDSKSATFDTIFIKSRGHFMDMLIKDNQLVVEANFLHNGNRQFVFDVSNFPGVIFLPKD